LEGTVEAPNRLRELRQARGFSQADLARLLGVSDYTVTRWETGQMRPTAGNARKLAKRLGVTVEALGLGKPT
jgi:transcriptional regulator with XRE-family HTH domain